MKQILCLSSKWKHWSAWEKTRTDIFKQPCLINDEDINIIVKEFTYEDRFDEKWKDLFKSSDLILLTHKGNGLDYDFLKKSIAWLYGNHKQYAFIVANDTSDKLIRGFQDEEIIKINSYLATATTGNSLELFKFLANKLGYQFEVKNPREEAWFGIYDFSSSIDSEAKIYATFAEYLAARAIHTVEGKAVIGILFYRDEWISGDVAHINRLAQELEDKGAIAVPFFAQAGGNKALNIPTFSESLTSLFGCFECKGDEISTSNTQKFPLHTIITTLKHSLSALKGVTLEELKHLQVPLLQAYGVYMSEEKWSNSLIGLTPVDINVSVSMPEYDGVIHGGLLACRERSTTSGLYFKPVEERVKAIAHRALKIAGLKHKLNQDKKIAIIFHNYPPKNSNIGTAAGLDSPESVVRLLACMAQEGYKIDWLPKNSAELMEILLANCTNDLRFITDKQLEKTSGWLREAEYIKFFNTLPSQVQINLRESWGREPGEVFNFDSRLLMPGVENGNLWLTVQPPRGFGEDVAKIYHDPVCPPPHHYEAFYYWLRDIWQADAVVHVGTHGSLEWLPGKGTGLGPACYPEMAIQDLPNIYPYWTTIVGEGLQAKRRSSACLIGHLSPPMAKAELYDEYETLEFLIDEYSHYKVESPGQCEGMRDKIRNQAEICHFLEIIPHSDEISLDELVSELHLLLTDLKYMQIRTGLHILGKAPEHKHLRDFILALVSVENCGLSSIPEVLAESLGESWSDLQNNSGSCNNQGKFKYQLVDLIWKQTNQFIDYLQEHDYDWVKTKDEFGSKKSRQEYPWCPEFCGCSEMALTGLEAILEKVCSQYIPDLKLTSQELDHVLAALSGVYIEPGPGGAPSAGRADTLPTGRNFCGVDERILPTEAAYQAGSILANKVIEQYILEEEKYPESIGMILWAGTNTRNYGQCVAQFMHLLGVRPVWQKGSGQVVDLEVIPLSELKRPRIDVTAHISGLMRDMMPKLIGWLDKAVLLVSQLEEGPEDNFIKKHVDKDVAWLVSQGELQEHAYIKSCWRIFGDPPGAYGSGVSQLLENKNWQDLKDITDVYVTWSSQNYSTGDELAPDERIYRHRLSEIEVTIKNEDNRETHILCANDYSSYHGGMIAAIRNLRGRAPKSFVGDSSDGNNLQLRTLDAEVRRIFVGELMNPKFISGMMEHGYKGAADLANYVSNTYQWSATTDVVQDWMYEGFAKKYAFDEVVQNWMKEVNPWALQRLSEVLLEAVHRGLWCTDSSTIEKLTELYLSLEGILESTAEDS